MRRELLRVECDAHRDALDHLDPVARRVLRGKERERGAGADADARDRAVVFDVASVGVRNQLRRLADAHAAQLDFLEVGVDPELIERNDRHQRRASGDPLSNLHGARAT